MYRLRTYSSPGIFGNSSQSTVVSTALMSKQPRVIKVMNRNVIETQSFSEEHNDEKRQVSETALLDMRPLLLYTLGPDRRTTVVAQIAREQRRRAVGYVMRALHPLVYLSILL
jgi:hypothetical protein